MHLVGSLTETDKQILEKSIVFNGLSTEEMTPFFSACKVRVYQPGQSILVSGGKGDGLYIVLEGRVEVFLPQGELKKDNNSKGGSKVRLDFIESGCCFGEYSLVDHKKVSASVSAFNTSRLFYLSDEDFYRIADAHLSIENIIYKNIMKLLISRCREANQELEDDVFLIY